MNNELNKSLREVVRDSRTCTYLNRAGVNTVFDLLKLGEGVLNIPNISMRTGHDIRMDVYKFIGIDLYKLKKFDEATLLSLRDKERSADKFNKSILNLNFPQLTQKRFDDAGANTILDIIKLGEDGLKKNDCCSALYARTAIYKFTGTYLPVLNLQTLEEVKLKKADDKDILKSKLNEPIEFLDLDCLFELEKSAIKNGVSFETVLDLIKLGKDGLDQIIETSLAARRNIGRNKREYYKGSYILSIKKRLYSFTGIDLEKPEKDIVLELIEEQTNQINSEMAQKRELLSKIKMALEEQEKLRKENEELDRELAELSSKLEALHLQNGGNSK